MQHDNDHVEERLEDIVNQAGETIADIIWRKEQELRDIRTAQAKSRAKEATEGSITHPDH